MEYRTALRTPAAPRRPQARWWLTPVLAAALLAALPLTARGYSPETYAACLEKAQDWGEACLNDSDSWLGDRVCEWAGGVLIIGCALVEAAELLADGINLPQ